jgi:hypothetical protein
MERLSSAVTVASSGIEDCSNNYQKQSSIPKHSSHLCTLENWWNEEVLVVVR